MNRFSITRRAAIAAAALLAVPFRVGRGGHTPKPEAARVPQPPKPVRPYAPGWTTSTRRAWRLAKLLDAMRAWPPERVRWLTELIRSGEEPPVCLELTDSKPPAELEELAAALNRVNDRKIRRWARYARTLNSTV